MLEAYRQHVAERAALGVPPKPLDDAQTAALVELLKNPPAGEEAFLVDLLENRVPAGREPARAEPLRPAPLGHHHRQPVARLFAGRSAEIHG